MTHKKEIQDALTISKMNLCEELSLDEIAAAAVFLSFIFTGYFKAKQVCLFMITLRKRRLAGAAVLLRTTGISILDIVVTFVLIPGGFHESLKRVYQLPPADIGQRLRI